MGQKTRLLAAAVAASIFCVPAFADLVPMVEPVVPTAEDGLEPFVPVSAELAESLKSDGFLEPILASVQKPIPVWCELARKRALEDGTVEYVASPGRLFEAAESAGRRLPGGLRLPAASRFAVPPAAARDDGLVLAQDEMEIGDPSLALEQDVCVECADAAFDAGELPMEKWQILGDEFEILPEEEGLPLAAPFAVLPAGGGVPFPPLAAIGGGGGFVPIVPVVTFGGGGTPGGGGGTPGTPGGGGPGKTPPIPPLPPVPLPPAGALFLLGLGGLAVSRFGTRRA